MSLHADCSVRLRFRSINNDFASFLSFVDETFSDPSQPGVALPSRMAEVDGLTKDFIFMLVEEGLDDCTEIPDPDN